MVRPKSKELTDRELAVMQVFWNHGEASADSVRQHLEKLGESIAYVTVANVVRGLLERGFLKQTKTDRPYEYRALRSFDDISKSIVGDLIQKLFAGSRESMLVHVLKQRKLTRAERRLLLEVIDEGENQKGSERDQ